MHSRQMAKLMISIRDENFSLLAYEARDRGITIQELIRAVIVPDWVRNNNISRVRPENNLLQHATRNRNDNEIPRIFSRPRPEKVAQIMGHRSSM
jgi:hypothetical protein